MFALLKAIPLRWWLYVAGAAAIAFILWREHHAVQALKKERAEKAAVVAKLDQANATIETMKADAQLNKETTHAYAERLADLERDRRDNPLPGLRCRAARPAVPTEGGAAAGTAGATGGREPGTDAQDFDPVPALDGYATDCAVIAERLTALQKWEAARTH